MKIKHMVAAAAWAALVAAPTVSAAQHAPASAHVDFGVLATAPLGALPCAQVGFGGPADPCSYKIHNLTPEEVTIGKGGEVTFQVHGGGHAMAIYEVSKNTTRNDLGQFLCPGDDPDTITDPTLHACNNTTAPGAANAAALHEIEDGKGDVVIVAAAVAGVGHPHNRVWSVPGRLMSAGGVQFLNGGTAATGTGPTGGQLHTYQFLKTGRYLVICMNRSHLLNDWMFGFVNVD